VNRFGFLLFHCCLIASSSHAADFLRDRSPDGRFGLLLQRANDSSEFEVSIIEIGSNKELLDLGSVGHLYIEDSKLLWSPDSRRVAYHSGYRRGGHTQVYFLSGTQLIEMPLHWDATRLKPNARVYKVISDDVSPVRWLRPNTLVLRQDWEFEVEKLNKNGEAMRTEGDVIGGATVTVRFDANNKASVQSVKVMSERATRALTQAHEFVTKGQVKQADSDNDGAIADYNRAIKLDPTNVEAYIGRGGAKQAKGDNEGAIVDYNRAIKLDPTNANAYTGRGDAKQAKGDNDGAIVDYNRAIEVDPINANAYNGRGNTKQTKGDNGGAIADYSRAIELNPDANYYYNRGAVYFIKRDWPSALADLRRSRELNKEDKDSPPWIWLIRARQGEKEAANQELAAEMKQHLIDAPGDWASQITNFLLGKVYEADFLAAAISVDAEKKRDQQCDAWFYAGMKRLLDGDRPAATDYFKRALATEAKTEEEYEFAAAELKTLNEIGGS
jgi:tetratricopeptide (TPR) repeat protein